eukprot:scaffold71877_cov32-Prasinocladus_malaysianus.AAC.1
MTPFAMAALTAHHFVALVEHDLEDGYVLVWVSPDQFDPVLCTAIQRHHELLGAVDHMEVGDDVAVLVPDEPAAGALRHLCEVE